MHTIPTPPPYPPAGRISHCVDDNTPERERRVLDSPWTKRWSNRNQINKALPILISVIVPCKNAGSFLDECMKSISSQGEFIDPSFVEVSVYDDGSTDDSLEMIKKWNAMLCQQGFAFIFSGDTISRGCGYARNRAVAQSHGQFLCFLDSDDIMLPERCAAQLSCCWGHTDLIVGSMYLRIPINATARYSEWHNTMTKTQLVTQQFKECTVAMPTWFMARALYDKIGGFCEDGTGTPEDMIFFYSHLRHGGRLERIDSVLLLYRYHAAATSFSVHCDTILRHKATHLEAILLSSLSSFSIWGGKHARELYRCLSPAAQAKVRCFLDIDPRKIGHDYVNRGIGRRVPVLHWTAASEEANRPVVVCVKPGLTDGEFEANLDSLAITEGRDFWYFA